MGVTHPMVAGATESASKALLLRRVFAVEPMGAPRMTRADAWKRRPAVLRYRAFRDACKASGLVIPDAGSRVTFVLPMPPSWSRKKRSEMAGKPHTSKPDIDNLVKAALDAIYDDDARVWDIAARKIWGEVGAIIVEVRT